MNTQEIEARVIALIAGSNGGIDRAQLVAGVFNCQTPSRTELANDRRDRTIRQAIENLRGRGFLIVSNSGKSGYRLATDGEEVSRYIAEQLSRVEKIQKSVRAIRRAYGVKDQMPLEMGGEVEK